MRPLLTGLLAATLVGCAPVVERWPLPDYYYSQETAERYPGKEPPPGAPREYSLPPLTGRLREAASAEAPAIPVLPLQGCLEVETGRGGWCATDRGLWQAFGVHPSDPKVVRGRYYAGKRWLPDDRVTGLAPDGADGIWVRTETGYSHLQFPYMTLEQKAQLFEERVRARHLRHGLVASCRLERPGDLSSFKTQTSDNDGLWTAMYVAAEAFRYAVTGSDEARRYARESYRAIERLQTISGHPGFPARSFVEKGESTGGGGEWHPTPDGRWLWKGDTSSDEIDGHFFVGGVYYDLVADESEKESIRRNLRAIMDHILGRGYCLVDLDGKPTTWGVWAPEKLNGDPKWWRDRGLNSLEILSYLAVTEHVTGDPKYRAAARELIEKHGYAENTLNQKVLEPPEEINHSDDELAFLCYYGLLRYEQDPRLRKTYLKSLTRSFAAERPEMNPLWIFIAVASGLTKEVVKRGPKELPLDAYALETLRETPLDMIEWRMENSHRRDLERAAHSNRSGKPIAKWPLHPAERGGLKYNSDPYRLDDGGDGREEDDGSFFLLSYWMGRYHRFIGPPADGEPPVFQPPERSVPPELLEELLGSGG